jgi:hypothetical protein
MGMVFDFDTLPPAEVDHLFDFQLCYALPSQCRLRVYHGAREDWLIVVTELDDNPGPSVSSGADQLHFQAWTLLQRPIPVRFFAHFPGSSDTPDAEHIDECLFPRENGLPRVFDASRFAKPSWKPFPLEKFRLLASGRVRAERGRNSEHCL